MKKTFVLAMGLILLCTGCGSNKSDSTFKKDVIYDEYDYITESAAVYSEEEMEGEFGAGSLENSSDAEAVNTDSVSNTKGGVVDREMLVYRGVLKIDTLDFQAAVKEFKTTVKNKGGFVQDETYSDNSYSGGYYVVEDSKKHNVYTATVRVPSSEYENIMESSSNLGDVRERESDATNVTQEYGTCKAQLEIYEAEYARYLKLLEEAKDDSYALEIENQLFEIQMNIATLKSQITNLENDVAYSYIQITINEVEEYKEEVEEEDSFGERFKKTCVKSGKKFLSALEDILFFVVMNIFTIIFIAVIVIVIWLLIRRSIKKRTAISPEPDKSQDGQV